MGFLNEDRELFRGHAILPSRPEDSDTSWKPEEKKMKKMLPLYIGLTTGFCGCLTSFSTFLRDVFLAVSNELLSPYGQSLDFHYISYPQPVPRPPMVAIVSWQLLRSLSWK